MSTFYSVVCLDPLGNRMGEIVNFVEGEGAALQYVLTCAPGNIGALVMTVPATVPLSLFPKDGRLIPYRAIAGRPPAMDNNKVFLIRRRQTTATTTTITAYDATSLLQRRIIAYYAGGPHAQRAAAPAGNQIKAFARDQLIAPTYSEPTDRYGDSFHGDVSLYLTVQADQGDGASVAKAAAWRNLNDVAAEIAQSSLANGTYATYEIVAPTEGTLELRTYAGQRGSDRRASATTPLVFSVNAGTLENVEMDEDWTQETNYAYAGGAGEGAARLVRASFDIDAYGLSPFDRCEVFVDDSNNADANAVARAAEAATIAGRARVLIAGDLVERASMTRGIHFDLGDYVTVEHRGLQVDVRMDTIAVQVGTTPARNVLGGQVADTSGLWPHLPGSWQQGPLGVGGAGGSRGPTGATGGPGGAGRQRVIMRVNS